MLEHLYFGSLRFQSAIPVTPVTTSFLFCSDIPVTHVTISFLFCSDIPVTHVTISFQVLFEQLFQLYM